MSSYLDIFNLHRQKVAVLENAHNIDEDEKINAVSKLSFDLPINDTKAAYCQPFCYARYGDGQMYRILDPKRKRDNTGIYSYSCEHVIATLVDDVIFGSVVVGGVGIFTRDVINYVLSKQSVARWVLDECDFSFQYEYGWENENLLSALFSIPNRLTEPYMWKYDTSTYPWRISLKRIDISANPQFYVRAAKNLLVSETDRYYTKVCTRLYLLGYGEGINQLKVSEVNNGLPYIQSDPATVNKYGEAPISRILVDRKYEDAQSLLEYGRAQLAALQDPSFANRVDVADLYRLTKADYDKAEIGRIIMLVEDNTKTYITGIRRRHDKAGDMSLTIANKPTDIADSIADLADRQRVESVYSQGATQIYAQSVQANATDSIGAVIHFFIPDDMRIVNYVKAKITLNRFRSYSRTTSGGGGTGTTSGASGGGTRTSSSGGNVQLTEPVSVFIKDATTGGPLDAFSAYSKPQTDLEADEMRSTNGPSKTYTGAKEDYASGSSGDMTTNSGGGGSTGSTSTSTASAGSHNHSFSGSDSVANGHTHQVKIGSYGTTVTSQGVSTNSSHSVSISGTTGGGGSHSHTVNSHSHSLYDHTHNIKGHSHTIPAHYHTLNSHTHTIPLHRHGMNHFHMCNVIVSIPPLTITIPAHTHTVTTEDHTHSVEIPDHIHEIEQGIFEFGSPSSAAIYVNGTNKGTMDRNAELDISRYLLNDQGKIPRGSWLTVEVRPNDLAYITIDLIIKGFCQSRGGSTY